MSKNNGKRPHKKPNKKARKSPAKSAGSQAMVPLIPQPHGGAIRKGSAPGNTPGTGRPPSALRATMREHLDLEVLADVMAKYRQGTLETLDVAEFLAKHGLGGETHKIEIVSPQVRENLRQTIAILNEELDAKTAERVLGRLDKVWSNAA